MTVAHRVTVNNKYTPDATGSHLGGPPERLLRLFPCPPRRNPIILTNYLPYTLVSLLSSGIFNKTFIQSLQSPLLLISSTVQPYVIPRLSRSDTASQ